MSIKDEIFKKLVTPDLETTVKKTYNHFRIFDDPTDNKLATNRQQIDNKLETNRQQTGNKSTTNFVETGNTIGNTSSNKSTTNWQRIDNKLATKVTFSSLTGLQRSLIVFLHKECKLARSKISEPLTLEHISKCLKSGKGSIKTTLQRLESKGYIIRKNFKVGRGGWSRYELPEEIFTELLQAETDNKLTTNWQQTDNKLVTQSATQSATSLPSSSSDLLITKTTTTELPENWKALPVDALDKRGIPFRVLHVERIYREGKMTVEMLESSFLEFIYDYDNNHLPEVKKTNIGFLLGIFLKGQPYVSEHYAEMVNAEEKRLAALAAKRSAYYAEVEANAKEGQFYEWVEVQPPDFLRQSIPDAWTQTLYDKHGLNHPAVRAALKQAYRQQQEAKALEPAEVALTD